MSEAPYNEKPDLSVQIAGITFKNPVIAASGTFGYGQEYAGLMDVSRLGGICTKGLTLHPPGGESGPAAPRNALRAHEFHRPREPGNPRLYRK